MPSAEWSRQIALWADQWHDDLVRFLVRRTAAPADAEDLAQEVYLRLLRVDRSDLILQPRSYLLRIAANLLHEWRLRARQARPHGEPVDALEAEDDPMQDAAAAKRAQRLAKELGRLPPHSRLAMVLQIREGLTHQQIAEHMGVTPRMVKRYLALAYASLRSRVPIDL